MNVRPFRLLTGQSILSLAYIACAVWHGTTCAAQEMATPAVIHSIYIAAEGGGSSRAVDDRLVERIRRSSALRVVSDEKTADAVLRVQAVVWPQGSYVSNARSGTVSVADYQGYASADLVSRSQAPLWSYLATPTRLHLSGITNNLADQIFEGLERAMKKGLTDEPNAAVPAKAVKATTLRAAGATFPAPLYRRWFESYAEQTTGAAIVYDGGGSVAGMQMLAAGQVDFAASDIPQVSEGLAQDSILRVPTVIGGVVPIFNLPGFEGRLRLTGEVLAGIYSGGIKRWNDPEIRKLNRGVQMPDAAISVVHRSDGSGTTFVWTHYLAGMSQDWKNLAGATVAWPTGTGASGNEGVAAMVQATPYSVGYSELTYAIQHQLNYASVRNPAGVFVHADLAGLVAAAEGAGAAQDSSLLNKPGPNSYPIATYTYFLVPKHAADARRTAAIVDFLRWMLTSGQRECSSLGYAPLPKDVADTELNVLKSLQ